MRAISRSLVVILMGAGLFAAGPAATQSAPPAEPAAKADPVVVAPPKPPKGPADDFDRGVPRSSVIGFLEAAEAEDWDRASEDETSSADPIGSQKRD